MSWVIIDKEAGKALLELQNKPHAKLKEWYEAIPILEYLQSLNQRKGA